jgi:hypothetical protein
MTSDFSGRQLLWKVTTIMPFLCHLHLGTVFVPTDEAFEKSAKDLEEALGVASVFVIPTEPLVAARVSKTHKHCIWWFNLTF